MMKHLLPPVTYYKANLHTHSTVSDGKLTPEEVARVLAETRCDPRPDDDKVFTEERVGGKTHLSLADAVRALQRRNTLIAVILLLRSHSSSSRAKNAMRYR